MTWLEGINKIKLQKANVEKLISIKGDEKALSAIVAWTNTPITRKEEGQPENDSEIALLSWLWDCIEYDEEHWRTMAGLKVQEATTVFQKLKGLRLIYPDGSAEDYATLYIRSIMNKAIFGESKPVGRPKKQKDDDK